MIKLGPPPDDLDIENSMPLAWYFWLRFVALWCGAALNIWIGAYMLTKGTIILGVFFLLLGIYEIYTRNALAKFRKNAPYHLIFVYILLAIIDFISNLDIFRTIIFIVFILANTRYFKKRSHYFDN